MKIETGSFVEIHSGFEWEDNLKSFLFYSVDEKIKYFLSQGLKTTLPYSFNFDIYIPEEKEIGSKFIFNEPTYFYETAELHHILYARLPLVEKYLGSIGTIIAPNTVIGKKYNPMLLFLEDPKPSVSLTLKGIEDPLIEGDKVMYIRRRI